MHKCITLIMILTASIQLCSASVLFAGEKKVNVTGISSNQDLNKGIIEAKNDAKRQAIEQVAGVRIKSSSLVTNFKLASDLILAETIADIKEYKVLGWQIDHLNKDRSEDPIIQLRVRMEVTVKELSVLPDNNFQLAAALDKAIFYDEEQIIIHNIESTNECYLYIISVYGDTATPIIPNPYVKELRIRPNEKLSFPTKELRSKGLSLIARTGKGKDIDYEQLLVIGTKFNNSIVTNHLIDNPSMSIQDFSRELMKIPLNERVIQILEYETRRK